MKWKIALLGALLLLPIAVSAGTSVAVTVGDPNFYGRIVVGDERPRVIYRDPVIVERAYIPTPVYMRVPPGHSRNWDRYCGRYEACDRRVYFVEDRWYRDDYAPRHRHKHHRHR